MPGGCVAWLWQQQEAVSQRGWGWSGLGLVGAGAARCLTGLHPAPRAKAGAARLGRQRSCSWLGKAGNGNGGKPAKERRARVLCEGREQVIRTSRPGSLLKTRNEGSEVLHVQQLARSCFLGRGCCDNPSGMGSGASARLVYFFSVEFTSECFQRTTGLFCGTLGDALGDREGGKVLGWPPGHPGVLPEQPCP